MNNSAISTELTNTISLGNEFLQHKVKRDYSDHKVALIREFLQNGVDAGASEMHFEFDSCERTLTIVDDGHGMDRDILVNCLFNLGGSHKSTDGAVGGFGAAKLILLFQHEWFKIETVKGNIKYSVEGCGSNYSSIEEEESYQIGTEIKIKFLPEWAIEESYNGSSYDSYYYFETHAKDFLETCAVDIDVYWNGAKVKKANVGELVKTLEWCEVYATPVQTPTNYVSVMIRGITMFRLYVSDLMQEVTVELTKNSLSILTSNRDGLIYSFRKELEALIAEFNIDKQSFKRLKGKQLVFQGIENEFSTTCLEALKEYNNKIVEQMEVKISQAEELGDDSAVEELSEQKQQLDEQYSQLQDEVEENEYTEPAEHKKVLTTLLESLTVKAHIAGVYLEKVASSIEQAYMDQISTTSFDFVVNVQKDINTIPVKLDPSRGMIKKYYRLAQLWAKSIDFITRHQKMEIQYKLGWVLSDDAEAVYRSEGDVTEFLINPELDKWFDVKNKAQQIKRIFRTACHECVHAKGHMYHDERFVLKLEEMLDIQDDITSWTQFEKEAYKIVL